MNVISLNRQESSYWVDWQKNQNATSLADKSTTEKSNENFENGQVAGKSELTDEEKTHVESLRRRDEHVRSHERAHLQAAGRWANSGAHYSYERGPDNKLYAVSGEVNIDISEERTPDETIAKMRVIKRAALAPADPSAQDKQVAARAAAIEAQARMEKSQEAAKKFAEESKSSEAENKSKNNQLYNDYLDMVFSGQHINKKA
jgi:hypothetical protein